MPSRDTLMFGLCLGLGVVPIVISNASVSSVAFVVLLLVVLIATMSAHLWWP